MPIQNLLESGAFDPEAIKAMMTEGVLHSLELLDQNDPRALIIAKSIIECARSGERDPTRLRDYALEALRRN